MTQFSDTFAAEMSSIATTGEFSENVTQRPLGVAANDVTRSVTFEETQPMPMFEGGIERVIRTGQILVDDAVTCTKTDQWLRGGVVWDTVAIKDAEGGLIEILVQSDQNQRTRRMSHDLG